MVVDLMAGRIQMTITTIPSVYPQIQAGALRGFGVGDAELLPDRPGLPPVSKAGVPGYVATAWNAVFVSGHAPQDAIDRFSQGLKRVLSEPKVGDGLHKAAAIPDDRPPAEAAAYIQTGIEKWAGVIKARHIVLQ